MVKRLVLSQMLINIDCIEIKIPSASYLVRWMGKQWLFEIPIGIVFTGSDVILEQPVIVQNLFLLPRQV